MAGCPKRSLQVVPTIRPCCSTCRIHRNACEASGRGRCCPVWRLSARGRPARPHSSSPMTSPPIWRPRGVRWCLGAHGASIRLPTEVPWPSGARPSRCSPRGSDMPIPRKMHPCLGILLRPGGRCCRRSRTTPFPTVDSFCAATAWWLPWPWPWSSSRPPSGPVPYPPRPSRNA